MYELNAVHLKMRKKGLKQKVLISLAIIDALGSVILFFTIIGIPIALFNFIGIWFLFQCSRLYQTVACSKCKFDKNKVGNGDLNFKCARCNELHLIEWS